MTRSLLWSLKFATTNTSRVAAGPEGLNYFRRIAAGAPGHLQNDGELVVEVGAGQAAAVAQIFEQAGLVVVSVLNDLAGHPRVVRARAGGG